MQVKFSKHHILGKLLLLMTAMFISPEINSAELEPKNRWLCPNQLDEPLGIIIEKKHERALTETYFTGTSGSSIPYGLQSTTATETHTRSVLWGLFLIPAPFDVVRIALLDHVKTKFGLQTSDDHNNWNAEAIYEFAIRAEPIGLLNRIQTREDISSFQKNNIRNKAASAIRFLEPLGFDFESTRATEIITKPYNLLPSREGLSQTALLVWDGRAIRNTTLSFVLVVRGDKAKEWGLKSEHVPIPGYWEVYGRHVTNTEYNLIQQVSLQVGTPFASFPFSFSGKGSAGYIYWKRAMSWIEELKAFPERTTPPPLQPCNNN